MGLLLIGAFVLYQAWSLVFPARPNRVAFPEGGAQRPPELREAFRIQEPLAPEAIAQELKPLFEGLGEAFRVPAQERLLAHFDLERMFDELVAQEAVPRAMVRDRSGFLQGLREGMGDSLHQQAPLLQWTTSEIRNIKKLQGSEAIVIVRHQTREGLSLKMRWWVTKRQGAWKVFDMEDLDMGMRLTAMMGLASEVGPGRTAEVARAVVGVREALRAVAVQQDPDTAERKLGQIARVKLPRPLEALRWMVTAMIAFQRGQPQEALVALNKARRYHSDMPCLDLFKGQAFNQLNRWDQALKHLQAYRDLLGDDGLICQELGVALSGLRRFPEACAAYRKALDHDPKNLDAFLGLLRALEPGDSRDDLAARFTRLGQPHLNFDICAEDCKQGRDGEGLEQLALAMRKIDPRHERVDYYLALAKVWAARPDQAVPLLQTAVAREKVAAKRELYLQGFLEAMLHAGYALEAYPAAPDAWEAFRFLATHLKDRYEPVELKRLLSAHAKKHPDDPLLPFFQAHVYVQEGKYQLAEEAFAAGMAKPPDQARLDEFRSSRVLARYHTGGALAAYAEIGPREETFRQLAALCFSEEKDAQLQALLDAHAKTDPSNPDVLRYRYRLKIRQDQVAEGIALFKAALAKQPAADQREELASDFLQAMVEAGKPLEAYQAAPDKDKAFQFLALNFQDSDRRPELWLLLDVHRRRHPADVWLAYYTGELLLQEQAWDKAAKVLGEGLKKAPEDLMGRFRSSYVFAMYKAGRGLEAYRQAGAPTETFNQLANLLLGDKKGTELQALIAAHRPQAGDDPSLLCYEARAKVLLKQPDAAIALIQHAYQQQAFDVLRKGYLSAFLRDMEEAGAGLEAYHGAPDKPFAFAALAGTLVNQKKAKELEQLLAHHGKGHATDPWYHYYSGELHLLRGEVVPADRDFTAALAKASSPNQWTFRNGLFRARIQAGKTAETYRENRPGIRTFEDLASLCLDTKNVKELEALVAVHARAQPDDPSLLLWDLEVKWLKQDYEAVLKLVTEHRQDLFAQPRYQWKADDYLVRCLVKLKKYEEAVREAEAVVKGKRGNHVLLVLVHAAQGGAKQAVAATERLSARPILLESCYQDPDLGPMLRSEPFREYRERFPEPKDKMGAGP